MRTIADYEDNLIVAARLRADALQFFMDDKMDKFELMSDLAYQREKMAEEIRVEIIGGCVK